LRWAEKALGDLRDAEVRLELLEDVLGPVAVCRATAVTTHVSPLLPWAAR